MDDVLATVVETAGIEPIPDNQRTGSPVSQFRIWFGANAVVSSLFLGSLGPIVFGLGFWATFFACIVGTLIGALAIGFASTLGPKTGMVQILFSRYMFGLKTGRIFGFFNALYCYAWTAVNLVTGTAAIQFGFLLLGVTLLGKGSGSYALWIILIALITVVISVLGYRAVHKWEKYSTYLSILIFAILTIAILMHHPVAGTNSTHGSDVIKSFFGMVLTAFGFTFAWIPYVSDYSRKLPKLSNPTAVFAYAASGTFLSSVWVEGLGALLTVMAYKTVLANNVVFGLSSVLGHGVLVAIAALIIGISTVSNNIPNDYTGGLSMQAAGIHVKRYYLTIMGGILSTLVAILFLQNFASKFQSFLLLLAYWVGAWFTILVLDYIRRNGVYHPLEWDTAALLPTMPVAVLAFVLALVAAWFGMIPIPPVNWGVLGQGFLGTKAGVDLGFVLAVIVAAAVMLFEKDRWIG